MASSSMIKSIFAPLLSTRCCYLARVVPAPDSAMVVFISAAVNARSIKMCRVASACFFAVLLALSSQETMAQGELPIEPRPFDSIWSPYPLGPLQKFGDLSSGSEARSSRFQAPAPRPRQVHAARNPQFQTRRRPKAVAEPRQTAFRAAAPQRERQRGAASFGSVLSLAP